MSAAHLAHRARLRLLHLVLRGRAGRALLAALLRTWRLQLLATADRVREESLRDFNAEQAYATKLQRRAERIDDALAAIARQEATPCA